MEPAEAIVSGWLQTKGYFTMNNIRVDKSVNAGRKPEIDILAVKFGSSGRPIKEKLHVEVSVSVHPVGKWDERGIRDKIWSLFTREDKIHCIQEYFGNKYQKMLVLSDKSLTEDTENVLRKNNIRLQKFSKVISELKTLMTDRAYGDETRRFLGLIFEHWTENNF